MKYDKTSYYLGMTFAFVECVVNDAKEMALTAPLSKEEYTLQKHLHERIVEENHLHIFWDQINETYVGIIYKYPNTILEYMHLRKQHTVFDNFTVFKPLLSYNQVAQLRKYKPIVCNVVDSQKWIKEL